MHLTCTHKWYLLNWTGWILEHSHCPCSSTVILTSWFAACVTKKSQNGRSDETYMDFISQHQSARNSCGFIKPQCGLLNAERLSELQGTNTVIQYWVDQLEAIRASGLPHLFLTRLKANKAWNRHRKPHYSSDPAHHHHHPPTPGGRTTISTPACQLSAREYVFIQN